MRKIFMAALLALSMGAVAQNRVIDTDYSKLFTAKNIAIDMNQNGDFEDKEIASIKKDYFYLKIDLKSFGKAGNIITTTFEKGELRHTTSFENVVLLKVDSDKAQKGSCMYVLYDSVGDIILMVAYVPEHGWTIMISNLSVIA